jgi:hypothetical protein
MAPRIGCACLLLASLVGGCAGNQGSSSLSGTSGAGAAPVFDVPRLDRITVDGSGADWGDRGFRVDVMMCYKRLIRPPQDHDCFFRLGWNDKGLLLLVTMSDNIWLESKETALLGGDHMEVGLRPVDTQDICHWVISPGMAEGEPNLRYVFDDARKDPRLKALPAPIEIARTRSGSQCTIEALLPWSALDIKPRAGQEAFFHLWTADVDGPGEPDYWLSWQPAISGDFWRRGESQRIRLAAAPGAPVTAGAAGRYVVDRMRTEISVSDLRGGMATVREGETQLARVPLAPAGRLLQANVNLPLPPAGSTYGPLTVEIDGKPLAERLVLPDVRPMRQEAIEAIPLAAKPCVFSGRQFPPLDLENQVLADALIGPYTMKVRYFDRSFREVTEASAAGRYGAIAEIQPEKGPLSRRFLTLFRTAGLLDWRDWERGKIEGNIPLPSGLGLSPAVPRARQGELSDFLFWRMSEDTFRSSETAVLFSGFHEADANALVCRRNSPQRMDQRWWFELARRTKTLKLYEYGVHLPTGFDANSGKRLPAILYLHGAGEKGTDLKRVIDLCGVVRYARRHEDFPFLVIVPQCPVRTDWHPVLVKAILDDAMAKYPIDADRVYLTGVSMGGYGTWETLTEYPDLFAATVPICGGGDPRDVQRIKDVPIWMFHGDEDTMVTPEDDDATFAAMKAAGARARYTRAAGYGHAVQTVAYYDDALYPWLLQQKRGAPQQEKATPESKPEAK